MNNSLKRILLVEDSNQDAELITEALNEHHLANDVVRLVNGEQALDYLFFRGDFSGRLPGSPAVILLDIKMPKVDGIEVLRQIKSHPDLKTIPVVMLTSSREEKDLFDSYSLGVNAYVVKPINFSEFTLAISHLGLFWAIINEPPPVR